MTNTADTINLMPILIIIIISIIIFFILIGQIKKLFLIRHAKSKNLDSSIPGLVIIKGVVAKDAKLINSPCSQKLCCWYEYTVEQLVTRIDSSDFIARNWKIMGFSRGDNIFPINYGRGQCFVATFGAEIDLKKEESWLTSTLPTFSTYSDATATQTLTKLRPAKIKSLISSFFSSPPLSDPYKITEKIIEKENLLTIIGYFQTLDVNKIEIMLEQTLHTNTFIQENPSQREILLKIKQYLLSTNQNSIPIISCLSPKKEKLIISTASLKALVLRYIINILLCLIISVAALGYLFYLVA